MIKYSDKLKNSIAHVLTGRWGWEYRRPDLMVFGSLLKKYNQEHQTEYNMLNIREAASNFESDQQQLIMPIVSSFSINDIIKSLMSASPATFREILYNFTGFALPESREFPKGDNRRFCELYSFADDLQNFYFKYLDNLVRDCKSLTVLKNIVYKHELEVSNKNDSYYDEYMLSLKNPHYVCKDIFSTRFFQDTFKNFEKNNDAFQDFLWRYEKKLSPEEKEKIKPLKAILSDFNSFHSDVTFEKFKNAYDKHINSGINYTELFYECFRMAKEFVAKEYVNACSDITSYDKKTIPNFEDVTVYNCGKQPFKMFISCTFAERDKKYDYDDNERSYDVLSCSFVSDSSLLTYKDLREYITFGFTGFDPKLIQVINSLDNYSEYFATNEDQTVSKHPFEFITPDEMLEKSKKQKEYNEVDILSYVDREEIKNLKGEKFLERIPELKPSCILSLGEPTKHELKLARKMEIPVFLITPDKYEHYEMSDESDINIYDHY